MALSDQLTRLAAQVKELEDRGSARQQHAKADIEQQVKEARESAQTQADALRKSAEQSKGEVSAWWEGMGRSWNDHITTIRKNVDEKRAEHDLKAAQKAAAQADDDAAYAVDYAYAAVDEAQYAVLDAILAHMDADELAAGGSGS